MTENTTNNLDSYFLKWISVWYIKRSIYIQKSKFTGHRQYSFIFLSQVFLLRLKRNSPQVLKSSSFKNLFFSLYVIDTTCFSEYFLFCVITGRNYFLWKFIITLRFFFQSPCCYLFEKSAFKKLHISCYFHTANIKFPKQSCRILQLSYFLNNFYSLISLFILSLCNCCKFFLQLILLR